eukprot:6875794-Heterocapsa_arctica.AAC.1
MDMRGASGRFFYRELKLDKQLKEEWAECGKSYDKQRKFKMKFARARYEAIVQMRTKTEQVFDLQSVDAEYCIFSHIAERGRRLSCVHHGPEL